MIGSARRINVAGYYALHIPAALAPVIAALFLYGWAALLSIALLVTTAWLSWLIWRGIGRRGRLLNRYRCLYMALVLSLTLPPNLLGGARPETWPIIPAAGILLIALAWVLAPLGSGRVQPVLASFLVLAIFFQPQSLLTPHLILKPQRMVVGNLFHSEFIQRPAGGGEPWIYRGTIGHISDTDAIYDPEPAAERLTRYTSGRQMPDRSSVSLQMTLRDEMPPLEDLIFGGQPGPIGASSAVAVILGGLILIQRGLIDYRIPLLACLAAGTAFLILPLPVVIKDTGIDWQWLAFRHHYLGLSAAVTFANYELLASPLLFVLFFLAPTGQTQPMSPTGKSVYGLLIGLLAAPFQLYGSVALGPYVALFLAGLSTAILDRIFSPRPLT